VIRHPPSDVALLQADAELAGMDFERLPVLLAAGHVDRFLGYGYGEGAYYDPSSDTELRPAQVGTTLLVGEFEDVGSPASYIRALASRSGSVCDGDSGGPAVLTIDGRAAVAGVLFSSEGSGACTPEGGAQLWTRLSTIPNGIQGALEDCVTTTSDGYTLVGCGRTEPRAGSCR
jgi:hypothetical protein